MLAMAADPVTHAERMDLRRQLWVVRAADGYGYVAVLCWDGRPAAVSPLVKDDEQQAVADGRNRWGQLTLELALPWP